MANGGFFEQKSASPARFALVVAGHAALLGAVMMAAGPEVTRIIRGPTQVFYVPPIRQPEPPPPPPQAQQQAAQPAIRTPRPVLDLPPLPPTGARTAEARPELPPLPPVRHDPLPVPDPPTPVRTETQVHPQYADALRPPYPLAEQRAQRSGTVVIRVTIGPDGRVRAAQRVSATSDAFWQAAERQALTRWRFRPATLDGRPVESTRTMTLHFRIEDV